MFSFRYDDQHVVIIQTDQLADFEAIAYAPEVDKLYRTVRLQELQRRRVLPADAGEDFEFVAAEEEALGYLEGGVEGGDLGWPGKRGPFTGASTVPFPAHVFKGSDYLRLNVSSRKQGRKIGL